MRLVKSTETLEKNEKKLLYMCNARPVLKMRALFSDATKDYRNPPECDPGDSVALRLRTGKYNVNKAYLCTDNGEYRMERVDSDNLFDYYEASVTVSEKILSYYFKVETAHGAVCYYNQIGASRELNQYYNFRIIPGYKVPSWAKGAVMYQIFVDRFANGRPQNNVLDDEYNYIGEHVNEVKDWYKYPEPMGVREFYGGDLQGVWDKLDYLENLGVDVIYFNPLFVSPSNHKYDIQDYDYIDPHIAMIVSDEGEVLAPGDHDNTHATRYIDRVTNRRNLEASNIYFAQLVEEIHKRGMKVIIDGVFNHCGSFNKWLDREHIYSRSRDQYESGAYERFESPYHSFFKFYSDQWPDNGSYDGCGDMIHFLSLIMKVQRNLKNIFWTLERNGCLNHTMLTDGDLTWRQIWDIVPSITMNSGKSSESQLRMPIHKLLFWRSIMAIHMTGSQAESGTRL